MKKALVLTAAATVLAGLVAPASAVPAPRPITRSQAWTKADSPVRIGSIHILAGATVTIEAGVEVVAEEGVVILVTGGLRALGTETEPVVFTGSPTWEGIRFLEDAAYPASTIQHARIEHAVTGVHSRRVAVPVNDTLFTNNGVALRVENPPFDMTFTGNEFYSNGTAFSGKTTHVVGIHRSDFWDNDVSMFFEAQSPYSCAEHHGIFDVRDSDILRGPDAEWYSYDVQRSRQSGETDMRILAAGNWWGTTDDDDIQARLETEGSCCPGPHLTRVDWAEPADAPQTPAEPPGPTGNPPEGDDFHGDPNYIVDLRHPDWAECHPAGSVRELRGVVHEVFDLPDEIPVSLVKGTVRCKYYDPGAGFVPRACDDPIEISVPVVAENPYKGRFSLELRRPLGPGRYTFNAGFFGPDVSKFRIVPD
ncbi:MAG TPA: hypothetical protein VHI71_09175 [Actinomycetota bacterium]|nr:hypothetical protein [Actinomycetota bacterium]